MVSRINKTIRQHDFLRGMYKGDYFPNVLVDKIKKILLDVCQEIEQKNPKSNDELFSITHPAVESINNLQEEFEENDSDLETEARGVMGADFDFIVKIYSFQEVDIEDVIAPRDW